MHLQEALAANLKPLAPMLHLRRGQGLQESV